MIYAMIHLNDLGSSTRYYSLLEKGVLTELMIMYLSKESALDPKLFDRITNRYTDEERAAFDFVIRDFFHLEGDGLYHCSSFDKLIEKSKSKSEKARKSVMARWDRNSAETKANNDRDTNVLLTNNQEPITNNHIDVVNDTTCHMSEETSDDGLFGEEQVQKTGQTGAPNCPTKQIVDLYHQILPELPKVTLITTARQSSTRSRWRDLYGAKDFETLEQGLNVFREYFEIVKSRDFLMGRCKPSGGREVPFRADYDWLMKQANFLKVCEGKYANARRK